MPTHSEEQALKIAGDPKRTVITFLALAVAFCLAPYYAILSADSINSIPDVAIIGVMWAPGLAALVTRLAAQRNLRDIGWRLGPTRYLLLSYVLPFAGCVLVYGSVYLFDLGTFSAARVTRDDTVGSAVLQIITAGFLVEAVLALGEELGWRGVLVPELARFTSFGAVAFLSGLICVAFHVPAILFGGYHSAAPIWFGLIMFTVSFTAASVILAWLRLRSGSVWTAVVFHASHNLFIQNLFDRVTVSGRATQYVSTEFGLGFAVFYSCAAIVCWRRRSELPVSRDQASTANTSSHKLRTLNDAR